jgi:hypothetical protein
MSTMDALSKITVPALILKQDAPPNSGDPGAGKLHCNLRVNEEGVKDLAKNI